MLGIGAAVSTGSALVAAAVLLGVSTIAFALTQPSRAWRAAPRADGARGAMKAPGVRTLVAVLVAVGCVFGGVEVAVAAAGTGGSAGPLLGLWGIGSLIGGVAAARLGGGARGAGGLAVLLLALGATHAALALAGSPIVLGTLLLLAGATIAPTYATAYAMVDAVAPSGTATEAFAWLATAIAVGSAAGSAAGGAVIDAARSPGRVRRRRPRRRVRCRHHRVPGPYAPGHRTNHPGGSRMTDITGVDFIALPVTDHARAAEFYGETLGLPFVKQWGSMPASEYQAGNLTLAVMQTDAFGMEFKPSSAMIALQVDDVPATRERLEAAGIEFTTDVIDSGVCHQAYFTDPDGNTLGLHHRYAD